MKGGKIVYINEKGEEVPRGSEEAVARFDTNKYEKLPLGGRRRTKKARRGKKRGRKSTRKH